MTNEEFDSYFDSADLHDEYMEYIMENCQGERIICNGDALIDASEEGYLYEEFRDYWMEKYGVAAQTSPCLSLVSMI